MFSNKTIFCILLFLLMLSALYIELETSTRLLTTDIIDHNFKRNSPPSAYSAALRRQLEASHGPSIQIQPPCPGCYPPCPYCCPYCYTPCPYCYPQP